MNQQARLPHSGEGALPRIVGPEAMRLLMAWRGGRRLSVPKSEAALAPIAGVIGEQSALRLLEEAAGSTFDIPRGKRARRLSTLRLRRMRDAGMRVAEIAAEVGCTERAVRKRLNKGNEV